MEMSSKFQLKSIRELHHRLDTKNDYQIHNRNRELMKHAKHAWNTRAPTVSGESIRASESGTKPTHLFVSLVSITCKLDRMNYAST